MAGGKKAPDPTKATPADSLAETPAEPTETTRDTITLALLQALALKVDALSTRLDEQDNNKHKEQRDIPSDDDKVGEGDKEPEHDARTAVATGGARDAAAVFIDPRDWEDLLPRATASTPSVDLLDAAHRTLEAVGDADEARLTYLRRFKAKKALTPEAQVAERFIYSRFFETAEHERSANVVDGLLAALGDKRLEARKEKDKAARERREQQRREADAKNRDKNGGRTGDKTRD
eukprot:jgi/Tetstr1/462879/TSEL_007828.t1